MAGMIAPCAAGSAKFKCSGRWDFLLCQHPGNSGRAIACQTQTVYLLDNRGGFLVYNEIAVLVHEIAVYRLTGEWAFRSSPWLAWTPGFSCLYRERYHSLNRFRSGVRSLSPFALSTVSLTAMKRTPFCGKDHLRVHTDLKIVSAQSRHIFYNDCPDFPGFNIRKHLLEAGTVKR